MKIQRACSIYQNHLQYLEFFKIKFGIFYIYFIFEMTHFKIIHNTFVYQNFKQSLHCNPLQYIKFYEDWFTLYLSDTRNDTMWK